MQERFEKLPVTSLQCDPALQMRVAVNQQCLAEYVALLEDNPEFWFPPVAVYEDSKGMRWLADGFQRHEAHKRAGRKEIKCIIKPGERRDAWKYALGANEKHGLKRSDADRQKAIKEALADEELSQLDNKALGKLLNVTRHTIARHKNFLSGKTDGLTPASERRNRSKQDDGGTAEQTTPAAMPGRDRSTTEPESDKSTVVVDQPRANGETWTCAECRQVVPVECPTCGNCGETRQAEAVAMPASETPALSIFTEPVHDHFGRPIPERLAEVFRVVRQFRSIVNAVGAIKTQVAKLKEDGGDGTRFLRVDTVIADFQNGQSLLASMAPHALCPVCDGRPGVCKEKDSLCGGLGWIRSDSYPHLPAELKAKCESYRGLKVHGAEKESA